MYSASVQYCCKVSRAWKIFKEGYLLTVQLLYCVSSFSSLAFSLQLLQVPAVSQVTGHMTTTRHNIKCHTSSSAASSNLTLTFFFFSFLTFLADGSSSSTTASSASPSATSVQKTISIQNTNQSITINHEYFMLKNEFLVCNDFRTRKLHCMYHVASKKECTYSNLRIFSVQHMLYMIFNNDNFVIYSICI